MAKYIDIKSNYFVIQTLVIILITLLITMKNIIKYKSYKFGNKTVLSLIIAILITDFGLSVLIQAGIYRIIELIK